MEHIKQAEQLLAKEGLKLGAVQNHFSLLRNDQQPIIDYCNSRPANKSQGIKRKFHKIFTKEK
ncbi:MAG: hypothetical protein IJA67_05315 [Oscillospiraceae bacterium]|nr:hypothetical protein [Oscillospiraceae bacterium]